MFLPLFAQILVIFLVLVFALVLVRQNRRPYFAFLFLTVLFIALIIRRLPLVFDLHLGLYYNWIGVFLVIPWVLIILWLTPLRGKDIGLTLKHRSGTITPAIMVTIGIIVFKGIIGVLVNGGQAAGSPPLDAVAVETLLFNITLAPLTQELLHSGLLLSLMIIALGGKKTDQKFDWNRVIILAIILTAFSHGIQFGLIYNAEFQFNLMAFIFPFIGKLLYAWLRLSTGSLLFPILAFSASNFVVWLTPYLIN